MIGRSMMRWQISIPAHKIQSLMSRARAEMEGAQQENGHTPGPSGVHTICTLSHAELLYSILISGYENFQASVEEYIITARGMKELFIYNKTRSYSSITYESLY